MLKKYTILVSLLILSSCKDISMILKTKYIEKSKHENFKIEDDKMLIKNQIDGKDFNLIFDTGALAIITDTTAIKNFSKLYKSSFGTLTTPDKKIQRQNINITYQNNLYEAKDAYVSVIQSTKKCRKNIAGLMGNDFFHFESAIVSLNFDSSSIDILTDNSIPKDYQEVKSDFFRGKHIKIYLSINGTEEPFHFDTGNSLYAPIVLSKGSKIKLQNVSNYIGTPFLTLSNTINFDGKNEYAKKNHVKLGSAEIDSYILKSTNYTSEYNNVGLGFIKNFNWILDFKNKKVFFKKNSTIINELPKDFTYKVTEVDKKIKIVLKKETDNRFSLGDEVIKINDELITNENFCDKLKLLNTSDWDTLKIEVKK